MTANTDESSTPESSVMVAEMVTTPPTISPGVGVVLVMVGPVVSMMKVRKTSEVAVPSLSLTSSSCFPVSCWRVCAPDGVGGGPNQTVAV